MPDAWKNNILKLLRHLRQTVGGDAATVSLLRFEEDAFGPDADAATLWLVLPRTLQSKYVDQIRRSSLGERQGEVVRQALIHVVSGLLDLDIGHPPVIDVDSRSDEETENDHLVLPRGALLFCRFGEIPARQRVRATPGSRPGAWLSEIPFQMTDMRQLGELVFDVRTVGRSGYVELLDDTDPEWPEWTPVPSMADMLETAMRFYTSSGPTLEQMAQHLNAGGFTSISGKSFTKASVRRVVIALELLRGPLQNG